MPTLGTSEHSRKHQINDNTSSSDNLAFFRPPGRPKLQNMQDVLGEYKVMVLKQLRPFTFVPFMIQSFIAGSAKLCHFMLNSRSLRGSSLIPPIPYQKLLCRLKEMCLLIMITCPCNVYPLTPHFYIVKLGFYRGIHFCLIFALKQRLWVLVRTASLTEAV